MWNWARSLGISEPSSSSPNRCNPSAHYSDIGINFFMSCLKTQLSSSVDNVKTEIRNRILVVSGKRETITWDFEAAYNAGMKVWTRENLEPTFSAITSGDADVLSISESEDNVDDNKRNFIQEFYS